MGFSLIGLMVSLAVLAPIMLLLAFPPRDHLRPADPPRVLTWVERAGQALCLTIPAITQPGTISWWWAVAALAALSVYYALWVRYLSAGRRRALLFAPLWGIPVPMALFPVAVFLCTAAWLSNPWIAVAALLLATGHIPVSLIAGRALSHTPEERDGWVAS